MLKNKISPEILEDDIYVSMVIWKTDGVCIKIKHVLYICVKAVTHTWSSNILVDQESPSLGLFDFYTHFSESTREIPSKLLAVVFEPGPIDLQSSAIPPFITY